MWTGSWMGFSPFLAGIREELASWMPQNRDTYFNRNKLHIDNSLTPSYITSMFSADYIVYHSTDCFPDYYNNYVTYLYAIDNYWTCYLMVKPEMWGLHSPLWAHCSCIIDMEVLSPFDSVIFMSTLLHCFWDSFTTQWNLERAFGRWFTDNCDHQLTGWSWWSLVDTRINQLIGDHQWSPGLTS